MDSEPCYVYLDTNTFLHHQTLTEIDWIEELQQPELVLVVPIAVIDELNKKKHSPTSQKLRERARKALSLLHGLCAPEEPREVREDVSILPVDVSEPDIDWAEHALSRDSGDDRIIATILSHGRPMPRIVLVTGDGGLRFKAQAKNIRCHGLSKKWRLPEEETPEQKELRELRVSKQRHDSAAPKLTLKLDREGEAKACVQFELSCPRLLSAEEIDQIVWNVGREDRGARDAGQRDAGRGADVACTFTIKRMMHESIREFAEPGLGSYRKKYRAYLEERSRWQEERGRMIEITSVLVNEGSAPADDIHVTMFCPKEFRALEAANLPEPPREPPPYVRGVLGALASPHETRFVARLSTPPPPNAPRGPYIIEEARGFEVTYRLNRLMHHKRCALDSFHIVFPSRDEAHSFQIRYSMVGENVPDPAEGELHVVIHKAEG